MSSALWSIQRAVVVRVNGWPALQARGFRLYDGKAPQGVAKPYGVIGEPDEVPWPVLGDGRDASFLIHLFSNVGDPGSSREVYELTDLVDAALTSPLTVAGQIATITQDSLRTLLTEGDGTRHMAMRKRFITYAGAV